MDREHRQELVRQLRQSGRRACLDVDQCQQVLQKLCRFHPNEFYALKEALHYGVPHQLNDALSRGFVLPTTVSQAVAGLTRYGVRRDQAKWAVDVWVEALAPEASKPTHGGSTGRDVPPATRPRSHVSVPQAPLCRITPGRFLMGSENSDSESLPDEWPPHEVTIARPYWLLSTPVSQTLWFAIARTNPSKFQGGSRPVESISWLDAVTFCNVWSVAEGLDPAYLIRGTNVLWKGYSATGYRLPTEAEWEFACRAGLPSSRYGHAPDIAWFDANSRGETHSVGEKEPNSHGLHDMLGNVWEWCWDKWGQYSEAITTDPDGPAVGAARIMRGGSFVDSVSLVRAACRDWGPPKARFSNVGLRVARSG